MAITVTSAAQLADGYRKYPISDHGKMRILYGKATQGAAAGDDGSSIIIGVLPPGRVRILPYLCRYKGSALGAARVMGIGYDAYFASNQGGAVAEAAAAGAFGAAIDVSGATDANFPVTGGMKYDIYSRAGVQIRLTITGGTIPAAATFEMLIVYVCE